MGDTPAAVNANPTATNDDDWLGYGAYADALWSRIETALAKDLIKGDLGDDPLVIGIFGEWGAGKSYLLRLMHDQAKDYAKQRIGWHKRDTGFGLTVPVVFQPWKYEHEAHLHVPLMLHIFQALQKYEKDAQVPSEKALEWAGEQWEVAKKAIPGAVDKFKGLLKASIAVMEPTTAALAMGGLGVTAVLARLLTSKEWGRPDPLKTFKYSEDGRFFYDMHETLKDVTRPTRQNGQKRKYSANDIAINFVVFVDDLDRCLPEKAVQTLELIKTMFNVESFAFVLALDDEVIERGIGHRYKEYKLQDKKPEMPITGFEYLEKIVHVPFRLPAMSKEEAGEFVARYERSVQPQADLRWFQAQPEQVHALVLSGGGRLDDSRHVLSGGRSQGASLLDIALSGFDACMPRKLIRLVELVHQVAHIARLRNAPIALTPGAGVDARVVLALLLVQLFQPELYRILRRRADSFPILLAAFSIRPDGKAPELPDARVSDIDLWGWAVEPRPTEALKWSPSGVELGQPPSHAVALIARYHSAAEHTSARNTAQHVRLPLVIQLVEHRAAHRHVFDVLKLVHSLAQAMAATQSNPHALAFEPYQHFLAQVIKPKVRDDQRPATQELTTKFVWVSPDQRPRFAMGSVKELVQDLVSADTAAQANLGARHGFPDGRVLHTESVQAILIELRQRFSGQDAPTTAQAKRYLLTGLSYLAPFVDVAGDGVLWPLVEDIVDTNQDTDPKLRALWGDVRAALGCDPRFDNAFPVIMAERFPGHSEADEPIPGFVRVPEGRFTMGSDHEDDKGDNPRREVEVQQAFYMQRTLVTVDQFAGFVRAGAYDSDAWWDQQGREWRDGFFDSKVANEDYKKHLTRRSKELRRQPMQWDEQRANGSHPVWGINWFEARAYCRWLSEQMDNQINAITALKGHVVQLPTELQWERAARASSLTQADGRVWPWGDDENLANQKANLSNTIGSVCAVGLYEANPIGLHDMAGNAWEWMDNLYQLKPGAFTRIPRDKGLKTAEDLAASDCPALRGGAWVVRPGGARCSSRLRGLPDGWFDNAGFRVVLSLAEKT